MQLAIICYISKNIYRSSDCICVLLPLGTEYCTLKFLRELVLFARKTNGESGQRKSTVVLYISGVAEEMCSVDPD
jgi:hypothetical protein